MILNKKEKAELVIKLLDEGKTTREIAQMAPVSLRDIGIIARKVSGDDSPVEREIDLGMVKDTKLTDKSYYAQCFQMFKENKSLVDVVIELDLRTDEVQAYYSNYLELTNRNELTNIYSELKNDFPLLLHLYQRIQKENLNKQDITDLLESQIKLKEMRKSVIAGNEYFVHLNSHKLQLEQEIRGMQNFLNRWINLYHYFNSIGYFYKGCIFQFDIIIFSVLIF